MYNQAEGSALHAKAVATDAIAQAGQPLDDIAGKIVGKIETAVPAQKGKVPKQPIDLLFFFVYLGVFCYIGLKIFMIAIRVALKIFCCVCCCGCCRSGKKAGTSKHAQKRAEKKAAPKPAPSSADAKGKPKSRGK